MYKSYFFSSTEKLDEILNGLEEEFTIVGYAVSSGSPQDGRNFGSSPGVWVTIKING